MDYDDNYLGFLDAEDEREKENLSEHFVITKSIKKALNPNRPFICGRRGSGKTAIAYELGVKKKKKKGDALLYDVHLQINQEDYKELQEQILTDIVSNKNLPMVRTADIEDFFYWIWKFTIEIALFQCVIKLTESAGLEEEKIKSVIDIVSGNGGKDTSPTEEAANKTRHCLKKLSVDGGAYSELISALKGLCKKEGFKEAREAAKDFFKEHSGIIIIDTLEKYTDDEYFISAWRGMCRSIKAFHLHRNYNKLDIKCFLPAELTHRLFNENVAKYNDFTVYLQWSYGELLEFIARRYESYLRALGTSEATSKANQILNVINKSAKEPLKSKNKYWREGFWDKHFEKIIINEYKWKENSAAYMIRHTQKRPREILSCMNFIIHSSREKKETSVISKTSIIDGIHHPDNLHQLLTDNLSIFSDFQLSGELMSTSELADTILHSSECVFKGSELKNFAQRAFSYLPNRDGRITQEKAIDILLRSGYVGTVLEPTRIWKIENELEYCKYYLTKFEYCIPEHVTINEKSKCAVHPMLADHLQLKDPERGIVYHVPEEDDLVEELNFQC